MAGRAVRGRPSAARDEFSIQRSGYTTMTEPFIGIDFGTCNSSAAWFNPGTGQAEVLTNAEGEDKTPSVVYFGPKNETVVGRHAEGRLESPEGRKRVLSAVKRELARKAARVV